MTIQVNLPPELEERLLALATKAGRSTVDQLREIIDQGLEDLEDYYAAKEVVGRIERGEESVLSSEDFWRGMDN